MAIFAHKGERVVTPDGRYLGTVARDLDGADRLPYDGFEDLQIDIHKASQRLPLTSWCLARMRTHG
jgi:hypothetical protein